MTKQQNSDTAVPSGTRARYRSDVRDLRSLAGQVRIVGPKDERGGAEMLGDTGVVMDHRDASGLEPASFWADFEPVPEEADAEQRSIKAVNAIVHELAPRVDRPYSWYHEHERQIARSKVVAQVESVLETKAFADAIENAVRRASSSVSDTGFVRIDRAIEALRYDLGIDR